MKRKFYAVVEVLCEFDKIAEKNLKNLIMETVGLNARGSDGVNGHSRLNCTRVIDVLESRPKKKGKRK